MKIGLIDVNGKWPNLALMKISAYHKAKGDRVFLNNGSTDYDKIYISCIYSKDAEELLKQTRLSNCDIEMGGYGINDKQLPYEIEHIIPDYGLYDIDYSIGFTSRGCIRKCPWCIVPKMEGNIRDHAPISEFLHPHHNKLILWDNNFLASPRWKENLRCIIDLDLKVSFNQGLDIRLIDKENANLLSKCKYRSANFKEPRLYFSWDDQKLCSERDVEDGIWELRKAGIRTDHLMFYVLCGYNTNFGEWFDRFNRLVELGVDPFVMPYHKGDQQLNNFARFVNKRIYKVCSWEEYRNSKWWRRK